MRKFELGFFLSIIVLFVLQFGILAQPRPKPKRADRNKDGVVDKYEQDMAKQQQKKKDSKVSTWWEKQADTNNDGIVDPAERSAWKKLEKERIDLNGDGVIDSKEKRLSWRHGASKVNTGLEKQYDANGDGFLQENEAEEYLNAKYDLVKTNGKAKVDSPLEEGYDTDNDGVIEPDEAEALKEDIQ